MGDGFRADGADARHAAVDAVHQDDAAGRGDGADLSVLPRFRASRHKDRAGRPALPRQSADRGVDAVHLFQGDPEGHSRGGADGWRDNRQGAHLCADADGGPRDCLDPAPQFHPGVERGFLDAGADQLQCGAAHGIHRVLFEPGGPVLGQAVGGVDTGHRADPGARLVQPAAAGARPHLRRGQIAEEFMGSIVLNGVCKSFGPVEIIKGVNLEIADKSFVVFVGPSGCGKSTLLRLIAGLEGITEGKILIDGADVSRLPPAKRGLSMVFQSYALYPHMTVRSNIGFGLKMAGMPRDKIAQRVEGAAAKLNLTPYLDRRPGQLSGGQRQRVAIGRAIVREPKAFLFDEPLSNLDAALRVQMRLEIATLQKTLGTTAIYVTHDQVEAMTMADRIVVLNAGHVEQYGTPLELYERPANTFVAGFIGSPKMNFVSQENVAGQYGASSIGVRPEHIMIKRDGQGWPGRIAIAEHLGSDTFFYVESDVGRITVRTAGELGLSTGDQVRLDPDPARIHRFDKDGNAIRSLQ